MPRGLRTESVTWSVTQSISHDELADSNGEPADSLQQAATPTDTTAWPGESKLNRQQQQWRKGYMKHLMKLGDYRKRYSDEQLQAWVSRGYMGQDPGYEQLPDASPQFREKAPVAASEAASPSKRERRGVRLPPVPPNGRLAQSPEDSALGRALEYVALLNDPRHTWPTTMPAELTPSLARELSDRSPPRSLLLEAMVKDLRLSRQHTRQLDSRIEQGPAENAQGGGGASEAAAAPGHAMSSSQSLPSLPFVKARLDISDAASRIALSEPSPTAGSPPNNSPHRTDAAHDLHLGDKQTSWPELSVPGSWQAEAMFPLSPSKLPALVQSFHESLASGVGSRSPGLDRKSSQSRSSGAGGIAMPPQLYELARLSVSKLGGSKSNAVGAWLRKWDPHGNRDLELKEVRAAVSDLSGRAGLAGAFVDTTGDGHALEPVTVSLAKVLAMIDKEDVKGQVAERVQAENSRTKIKSNRKEKGGVSVSSQQGRAVRRREDEDAFTALDVDNSGVLDVDELIAYYTSQGMRREQIMELIETFDADHDGTVSRAEWRDGLGRFREAKMKTGAELAWMAPMMLEAVISPVRPPRDEDFKDLKPTGRNYRSDHFKGTVARIPKEEDRATRIEQLHQLWAHIERRCASEDWRSIHNGNELLSPSTCDTYDLCSYVLQPSTYFHRCSFVELLAEDDRPQRPDWFLSHWWGEKFKTLLQCLEQQVKDRRLDTKLASYWMCATALNQWELQEQLKSNPAQSSFVRALSASGGVVSVVDSANQSTFGTRLWCNFEVCTALDIGDQRLARHSTGQDTSSSSPSGKGGGRIQQHYTMKYDVYTLDHITNKAAGLTDGKAADDGGSAAAQASRQRGFSLSVLHAMYKARVQEGAIMLPPDRTRILNAITGCPNLDAEPEVNHVRYHHLNMLLLKRAWHLGFGFALSQGGEERERLFRVLKNSTIDELKLSFMYGDAPAPYANPLLMVDFFHALPESLIHLKLGYPFATLPGELQTYQGLRRIQTLDLSDSIYLLHLPEWLDHMPQLETLLLRRCVQLKLTEDLYKIYNKYKNMVVDLTGCSQVFFITPGRGGGGRPYVEDQGKQGGHKNIHTAPPPAVYTPFLEANSLEIVQELMRRAENDIAADQLAVLDGRGDRVRDARALKVHTGTS